MEQLIAILLIFVGAMGPSIVIAVVGYSSIRALGMNPTMAPRVMLFMIFVMGAVAGLGVAILLTVFKLFAP